MKKSLFWKKMKILTTINSKDINMNELYISDERPNFFANIDDYDKKNSYNDKELQQLSDFYRYNFRIGKSNNTIFIPKYELQKILDMKGEIITLYKENNLIGSIISYEIPLSINVNINKKINDTIYDNIKYRQSDIVFGCTTCLILHKKYRGTGLGMALIQESLQVMHETGIKAAYFVNDVSRCANSITNINWYFPLNLEKLDNCHFLYPREFRSRFQVKDNPLSFLVDNHNLKDSHNFYIEYIKEKPFYFSPSFEYYQKWVDRFRTYIVLENNNITGIFTFNHRSVWYPSLNAVLEIGYLITCIGNNIDFVIQQVLLEGKKTFDLIIFHELGDIKAENLDKIFAQRNYKTYINFFNTPILLKASDFYAPVL